MFSSSQSLNKLSTIVKIMPIIKTGRSQEYPVREDRISFPLEKIVLKLDGQQELKIDLSQHTDERNHLRDGWYIQIMVDRFNFGYVNKEPYSTRAEAEVEYNRILNVVQQGAFVLEYDTYYLGLKLTK